MDAVLYQHDDGRHAVAASAELATFAVGEPAWHRVGPVEIVGTPAAPSDAMLQVENAGLQSSVGHLGALVDELRGLLRRAIAAMSALHSNASPIDESSSDLDARIPAGAFRAFVDEHAALMYEQANGAAAPPLGPLQVDAGRRLAHMWLTAHYSDAHSANEIERVCWEILKPGDLSERPALAQPAPVQQDAPAPSMVGDAIPYAVHAALRDAGLMLFRTEHGLRVDKALTGIAAQVVEVCPDCDIADCRHIRARRAAISGQKPAEGETV